MKNKQKVTIDDLAVMIAKGFKESSNNLNEFKKEMYVFRDEVYKFKDEMYRFQKDTKAEFKELRSILSVNEYKLQNHEHRLCKIEN
jgi:hypothetical protein